MSYNPVFSIHTTLTQIKSCGCSTKLDQLPASLLSEINGMVAIGILAIGILELNRVIPAVFVQPMLCL
ncbi:hypothetical protein HJG54_11605 [Leptolyngbya sp. NK1-12]|uniref:Uncharacterized protein n=1 Tax=Leptolyngbya sp. NK1-12 TaxID=2547451 RepID=A0AA96WDX0_9CYAN|nr:hypothetical protein [Leptolyngbya sp. NK1-12]WNZ23434.1 hypothetical protein HJG54_11605 [Leptolyngbya sp. NK1-12]